MLTRKHDSGFTLVEMIIAMVILAIVLAGVSSVLLPAFDNAATSSARGTAQARSNQLLNLIANDVKNAKNPSRSASTITAEVLRSWLRGTSGADYADITTATSTQLWMRTDAINDASGATECVGYVDGANGLERRVFAAASPCPATGTPTETRIVIGPAPAGAPATPRFRYVLEYNPAIFTAPAGTVVNIAGCRTLRSRTLPATIPGLPSSAQNKVITGVEVAGDAWERGRAGTQVGSSYPFLARRSTTYRAALGCAYA